jgi:ubiquinone/menaquinone biosynthesis C-methylase UbiE
MYQETADIETSTDAYAARFSGQAGQFFLDQQTAITLDLLRDQPKARVLDVGGGHAQLAEPLVERGFEVTVTGSNDSCRKRLDQRISSGKFTYQTCDNLSLPFDTASFDVVMAFRLLPHVNRWQEIISELCRVAAKCVIIDYPDRRSTNIFYGQFFGMKKKMEGNTRPYTLFTRSQLAGEIQKNGFSKPVFRPEFLLPMVLHRKVNNRKFSLLIEKCFGLTGITTLFGSPIILRSDRLQSTGSQ